MRTILPAWAKSCAGWRSRLKIWAWKSIQALPLPKCCITKTVRSKALRPAIWAWAKTANRPIHSSPAWSFGRNKPYLPKAVAARFPSKSLNNSSSTKTASRKLTAWALKKFGKCRLKNISPVWLCTAQAGRWTAKPTAARLFITLTKTKSLSALWSVWIIKTLICRRLKSSNVSKPIPKSAKPSKAAAALLMARVR